MAAPPLALAAVLAMAGQCAPGIDPNWIAAIAQHESGFVQDVTHLNHHKDGTTSIDYGLMQINDRNFGLLHLTKEQALDPCASMAAAERLLHIISTYNCGNATCGLVPGGYTSQMVTSLWKVKGAAIAAEPIQVAEAPQPACAPSWDVWRQVACRKQQGGSP